MFEGLFSQGPPPEWEGPTALTLQTDIWLVVRVPVLSEQMTDVQPRVSTEGKLLTMAFFFAIRRVPKARQVVMTAGRPVVGAGGWTVTGKVRSGPRTYPVPVPRTCKCYLVWKKGPCRPDEQLGGEKAAAVPSGIAATARATAILK